MGWDPYIGVDPDFARKNPGLCDVQPSGKMVIEALDWGVDDETAYVKRAIDAGVLFTPAEAVELIEYHGCDCEREVIEATCGAFDAGQADSLINACGDSAAMLAKLVAKGTVFTKLEAMAMIDEWGDGRMAALLVAQQILLGARFSYEDLESILECCDDPTSLAVASNLQHPLTASEMWEIADGYGYGKSGDFFLAIAANSKASVSERKLLLQDNGVNPALLDEMIRKKTEAVS